MSEFAPYARRCPDCGAVGTQVAVDEFDCPSCAKKETMLAALAETMPPGASLTHGYLLSPRARLRMKKRKDR